MLFHHKINIARIPNRHFLGFIILFMVSISALIIYIRQHKMYTHYCVAFTHDPNAIQELSSDSKDNIEKFKIDRIHHWVEGHEFSMKLRLNKEQEATLLEFLKEINIEIKSLTKIQNSFYFLYIALLLILMLMIFIIILITRTFMITHEENIKTLQLMGAKQKYIKQQFQKQFLKVYLGGALTGISLIIFVFLMTNYYKLSLRFIVKNLLDIKNLIMIALIPLGIVIFANVLSMITISFKIRQKQ